MYKPYIERKREVIEFGWRILGFKGVFKVWLHLEFTESNSALKFLEKNVLFSLCYFPYVTILILGCCLPSVGIGFELRHVRNL